MMLNRLYQLALCVLLGGGCGSQDKPDKRDPPKASTMTEEKRFDFLAADIGTHELYVQHRGDGPDMVSMLRAALRRDARPTVRQNAIVALTAWADLARVDDFVFALDDHDPAVVSEAGFSIAAMLKDVSLPEPTRSRGLEALRAHAAVLRDAFSSTRERVRFNVMMGLEAIDDREFDIAKALRDEASLIRNEGLALAIARANADQKLSSHDLDALTDFVQQTKDPRFHDDAMDLLVRFAPDKAGTLLVASIADDSIGYQGLKHLVELRLTSAVPAIISYIKTHPGQWSKEHLQTLAAFHATCSAPLMADLLGAEQDKVRKSWVSDALRALSEQYDVSDKDLLAWARRQNVDTAPCR